MTFNITKFNKKKFKGKIANERNILLYYYISRRDITFILDIAKKIHNEQSYL